MAHFLHPDRSLVQSLRYTPGVEPALTSTFIFPGAGMILTWSGSTPQNCRYFPFPALVCLDFRTAFKSRRRPVFLPLRRLYRLGFDRIIRARYFAALRF